MEQKRNLAFWQVIVREEKKKAWWSKVPLEFWSDREVIGCHLSNFK